MVAFPSMRILLPSLTWSLSSLHTQEQAMLMDVYCWAIHYRDEPTNVKVISEDISLFVSGLVVLSKNGNNILLAHSRNTSELLPTASSVWLWTSLSTGGSPLDNLTRSSLAANHCSACLKRLSLRLRVAKKQKKRWTKASHFKLKMSLILGLHK